MDETSKPVWRALADSTRRALLDLLRERPRTTGELCAEFPALSRFAVMKHLSLLEEAELVTVRKQGRERWNYLNAVPLQRMYERWLHPYEAHWASALLRLQQHVEDHPPGETHMADSTVLAPKMLIIAQEVTITAPPSRVFTALTQEIEAWWGAPYFIGDAIGLRVDARLGGLFEERWEGDSGALWGVVTSIKRDEHLEITGSMGMPGIAHNIIRYTLEPQGAGTLLKFSHQGIGDFPPDRQEGFDKGWHDLLELRLKPFVERGDHHGLR